MIHIQLIGIHWFFSETPQIFIYFYYCFKICNIKDTTNLQK